MYIIFTFKKCLLQAVITCVLVFRCRYTAKGQFSIASFLDYVLVSKVFESAEDHSQPHSNFRMAGRYRTLGALQLAMMVFVVITRCAAGTRVFTACGGVLEEPRGIVQSPNFPARMPAPLACHWVIRAPPDKKIVVYFTQYFLRGVLRLIEYDHYVSEYVQAGRNPLGEMNFEEDIRYVVAYRPYVVLELRLQNVTNLHLRVEDYLEDVYGFNITYEILNRTQHVRDVTCSVMSCSFLGHCLAAADFSRFQCACFPGFYGRECQYGPYCDPDKGINMCANNGRCRSVPGHWPQLLSLLTREQARCFVF